MPGRLGALLAATWSLLESSCVLEKKTWQILPWDPHSATLCFLIESCSETRWRWRTQFTPAEGKRKLTGWFSCNSKPIWIQEPEGVIRTPSPQLAFRDWVTPRGTPCIIAETAACNQDAPQTSHPLHPKQLVLFNQKHAGALKWASCRPMPVPEWVTSELPARKNRPYHQEGRKHFQGEKSWGWSQILSTIILISQIKVQRSWGGERKKIGKKVREAK